LSICAATNSHPSRVHCGLDADTDSTQLAYADKYADNESLFRNADESAEFFAKSYGYALYSRIGEAGFIVGGAHGKGRLYVRGKLVGDVTVSRVSAGFQAGGKVYSQIIVFEDQRAADEFESGSFEFDAEV
jgi:lipid-binding SYLF domain-containing protein